MFASGAKSFLIRRSSPSWAWGNEAVSQWAQCPAALLGLGLLLPLCCFPHCRDHRATAHRYHSSKMDSSSNSGPFCDKGPMTLPPEKPTCPFPFSWPLLSSLGALGSGINEQNKKLFFPSLSPIFPKEDWLLPKNLLGHQQEPRRLRFKFWICCSLAMS